MGSSLQACTAVILAGGQSSRMGRDKAELELGGSSLLAYMIDKLSALGFDDLLVCRNDGSGIADEIPGLGPLGALYTLARRYPGRNVLVVPVDMPLLKTATLEQLCRQGRQGQIPLAYRPSILPLWLPLNAAVVNTIEAQVAAHTDLSLAHLMRHCDGQFLSPPDDSTQFDNANTPAQWQRIRSAIKQSQKMQ